MNKFFIFICASIFLIASDVQAIDIFYAISHGKFEDVESWVESRPDTTIRNESGQSVLHVAVITGNKRMVELMLESHVPVNILDNDGKTALDYAADYGFRRVILCLAEHQAKVTTKDNADHIRNILKTRSFVFFISNTLALFLFVFGYGYWIVSVIIAGIYTERGLYWRHIAQRNWLLESSSKIGIDIKRINNFAMIHA